MCKHASCGRLGMNKILTELSMPELEIERSNRVSLFLKGRSGRCTTFAWRSKAIDPIVFSSMPLGRTFSEPLMPKVVTFPEQPKFDLQWQCLYADLDFNS